MYQKFKQFVRGFTTGSERQWKLAYTSRERTRSEAEGFTLFEIMVSITIVVGILAVVLSGQSNYTDGAAVRNLADSIGLAFSQAQSYGISVREATIGSNQFNFAYGIEFRLPSAAGSNDAYIFFVDRNESKKYDSGWSCPTDAESECIEKAAILYNNTIDSLCSVSDSGAETCNLGRVDVTYIRPSTEATIKYFNSSGGDIPSTGLVGAKIVLRSPRNATTSVTVYKTGQISAQ